MKRATHELLTSLLEQQEHNAAALRAWRIVADGADTPHERDIARQRADRCERRLVQLDRMVRHTAA